MGRPALPPGEKMAAHVVYLSAKEWERIGRIAKEAGTTRALLIRNAVARIR